MHDTVGSSGRREGRDEGPGPAFRSLRPFPSRPAQLRSISDETTLDSTETKGRLDTECCCLSNYYYKINTISAILHLGKKFPCILELKFSIKNLNLKFCNYNLFAKVSSFVFYWKLFLQKVLGILELYELRLISEFVYYVIYKKIYILIIVLIK